MYIYKFHFLNYSSIVHACTKIISEFYVYNHMVPVFNIVCSENCANSFLNMKRSLLKSSYFFFEMFWTLTGAAVADGGSLPFKHFDPLTGVSEDDLEKVLCN